METVTYHIQRYHAGKAFTSSFTFSYEKEHTILWGLQHIKETQDATLTFVASCRSAVCGACSVRVNGRAMLACETKIVEVVHRFGSDEIHLSPLAHFEVIRDLVVDWEKKVPRIKALDPWMYPKSQFSRASGTRQSPEAFKKFVQNTECILCGSCASECQKLSANQKDFLEPFVFAKAAKFLRDSRDVNEAGRVFLAGNQGLWKCVHCMQCISVCPKKLEPAKDIARMRRLAVALGDVKGKVKGKGVRHAKAFKQDLLQRGRLNEVLMSLKTDGVIDSVKQAPYAIRLMLHQKINPLDIVIPPAKVEGIEGISKMVKKMEEHS